MDVEQRIITDAALVIKEGRIAYIGDLSNLPEEYKDYQSIDIRGKVVFPGFVNLHTHAALSILRGIGDDMGIAPAYAPDVPQGVFLSPHEAYVLSLLGGVEAVKFGTTCIVDNYVHENEAAKAFVELGMRAFVSERLHDADLLKVPQNIYEFSAQIGDSCLNKGIELIEKWHGTSNMRIQSRIGPHAPDTCSTHYLEKIRIVAEDKKVGLVMHVAQSKRESDGKPNSRSRG